MSETDKQENARSSALATFECIAELLTKLEQADCSHDFDNEARVCDRCELAEDGADALDVDEIREELQEMPLSVQVREDWHNPGETGARPAEFELLMGTGGPAVRIRGELDEYGQPTRAYLQAQDWYIPWFDVTVPRAETLLEFASTFYYGEGE
jgi:hypothetical protein